MPKKPIFYFKKMDSWDIWPTAIYLLGSLLLAYYFVQSTDNEVKRSILSLYGVATQFSIYPMYYKPLRNLNTYIIWLGFSIVHLCFYFYLRNDAGLLYFRGSAATILANTLPLLLLYQVLRVFSLKVQKMELVSPDKGIHTERKLTAIDILCFFIYYVTFIILSVLP